VIEYEPEDVRDRVLDEQVDEHAHAPSLQPGRRKGP